jgi:uncharacterized membrane protein YkoI
MNRIIAAALLLIVLSAPAPAVADEQYACLGKAEQRAAISSGQAVRLASAIRSVRGSGRARAGREVIKARLCRETKGLVYVLTVLSRDGKVTHASVDATSGKIVDVR